MPLSTIHPLSDLIGRRAELFEAIEGADLKPLMERIGDAEVVLLGEASHGTSEFYRMRQRITRELIREKGFNCIAVEADWPDAEHVDDYVRLRAGKPERPREAFARFPTWMWRNMEVLGFVEWLREHNHSIGDPRARVSFHGLDLYSLYNSIHEVLEYFQRHDPEVEPQVRERYGCLLHFEPDPQDYGSAVLTDRHRPCEDEVVEVLRELFVRRLEASSSRKERIFDSEQNARVVANAEQYYRTMYYGGARSWNLRDSHMFETLSELMEVRGPNAKAVVWAHNSHVGDAGATEMSRRGEINIGHLCRKHFGERAFLLGFGTHTGTVAAADNWGDPVKIKEVVPSRPDSFERICHDSGRERFFLPLRGSNGDFGGRLEEPRLERAIGVIYRPQTERQSHYFHAVLSKQFDEYVWFNYSRAVHPIAREHAPDLPELHPFLLID